MSEVRRITGLVVFALLGGCALLTGANELETGNTTSNPSTPSNGSTSGSSGSSSSGTTSTSSSTSGTLPGFDSGNPFDPFQDASGSSGMAPTLDGGLFPDGAKPDPRAGISCGNSTCAPGAHCCLGAFPTYQCAASCSASFGDLACDEGYDCPAGKVCCGQYAGSLVGSAQCVTSCTGVDSFTMCSNDQECAPNQCLPVDSPLGGKYRACRDD